jgi:glycosyltransferase involved in cell wall biosynthesis
MTVPSGKTILLFTQSYLPDPMSVGQHLSDVAREMVRRGHRVHVVTANRGYDDPSIIYPAREVIDGVDVRRIPLSAFGKNTLLRRAAAAGMFAAQCAAIAMTRRHVNAILVSTVPPLGAASAVFARYLRGVPIAYWVMDLNPEQLVALGSLRPESIWTRALDAMSRALLRMASMVVTLDRFMAARVERKAPIASKLQVFPPWPHEDRFEHSSDNGVPHEQNSFRRRHALENKVVVMYSGNHSISHPLRTVLEAAARMQGEERLVFLFVGGGAAKKDVERFIEQRKLVNARSVPYQPLAEIRHSLSAADVHLVTLGDQFVGINHPCKVYGAMAVSRPVLYLGPRPSHIDDLLEQHGFGWRVAHGDVDGAVRTLREIVAMPAEQLRAMGSRARLAVRDYSQAALCGRFCDALEGMASRSAPLEPARPA